MPRRTIREARAVLEEDLAPTLNEYWRQRFTDSIAEAEGQARRAAEDFVNQHVEQVSAARDEALRELCDVRDDLGALASEGAAGRVSAKDYTARYQALSDRQSEAERTS